MGSNNYMKILPIHMVLQVQYRTLGTKKATGTEYNSNSLSHSASCITVYG